SISTLATFVTGYSGERFKTISEGPGQQNVHLVKTRIIDPDGSHVNITYIAKRYSDGWNLVDVVVDAGISELAVRQSEYRLILKKNGIDGLIRALNVKADQLMS
ncbi:MAG TPA: ABC transporter substrate-binding protein, partial [Rhodospirillales bacterium]|nr:ABC transporter substrate-binding protein [Rhodospirillales bacterium]